MAIVVQRISLTPLRIAVDVDRSSAVIKAGDHRLLLDAREAVDVAAAQAERIVDEARRIYETEKVRGYQEGTAAARLEQAERMIENVSRAIDYFARVEADAIDLVMNGVRKIVNDFDDTEKVIIVVRGALAAVRNQKQITLRLHPDDAAIAKQRLNDVLAGFPAIGFIDVVADGRLAVSSCILETDIGLVETSLDGQLLAMRQAFQRVLGDRTERAG